MTILLKLSENYKNKYIRTLLFFEVPSYENNVLYQITEIALIRSNSNRIKIIIIIMNFNIMSSRFKKYFKHLKFTEIIHLTARKTHTFKMSCSVKNVYK